MLVGTLGASLSGNILAGKGINTAGKGRGINRAGQGATATRQGRGIVELVMAVVLLKWIFDTASSFNQF